MFRALYCFLRAPRGAVSWGCPPPPDPVSTAAAAEAAAVGLLLTGRDTRGGDAADGGAAVGCPRGRAPAASAPVAFGTGLAPTALIVGVGRAAASWGLCACVFWGRGANAPTPDRSPGRSPRPWPKDSLELLPQPAPQQPPSKPIVYTLSPHSTPSTASGSQKKHTIQIPGLVPSQKPSYSPSAPYKPGQSTGGIAPTPSAASLTTFGLQPQDTQASSQDPPYGHSIMQREKKQQGGREEAAEIRPSATRLPTAVGLRPRAPVVAAGAAASATPAFDPGEAPSGLPIPQAPALGSGLAAPAHTPSRKPSFRPRNRALPSIGGLGE